MKKLILLVITLLSLGIVKAEPGLIGDVLSIPGRAVEATGEVISGTGRALSGRPYYYGRQDYYRSPYYEGRVVPITERTVSTIPAAKVRSDVSQDNCQIYYEQLKDEFNVAAENADINNLKTLKSDVQSYLTSAEYQNCPMFVKRQFRNLLSKIDNKISMLSEGKSVSDDLDNE